MLRFALDIVLPRGCAGCDAPDEVLCAACMRLLHKPPRCQSMEMRGDQEAVAVWSCAAYRGRVRRAILAWKDHDDVELDSLFGACMASLALHDDMRSLIQQALSSASEPVLVIPAPSSRRSLARRGRKHLMPLVQAVSMALETDKVPSQCYDALVMRGVRSKSVQSHSRSARARRVQGHMNLRRGMSVSGRCVVLVDDIITSGATLRQCAKVIEDSGGRVLAAMTLACAVQHPDPHDRDVRSGYGFLADRDGTASVSM